MLVEGIGGCLVDGRVQTSFTAPFEVFRFLFGPLHGPKDFPMAPLTISPPPYRQHDHIRTCFVYAVEWFRVGRRGQVNDLRSERPNKKQIGTLWLGIAKRKDSLFRSKGAPKGALFSWHCNKKSYIIRTDSGDRLCLLRWNFGRLECLLNFDPKNADSIFCLVRQPLTFLIFSVPVLFQLHVHMFNYMFNCS